MSQKIMMPALTAMLSVRSGDSREQVENFLRELFDVIRSALEEGESVKVPGMGIFKTIDVEARKSVDVNTGADTIIPEHKKIVFLPCKELASSVNAPFEMFETVELPEEIQLESPEETETPIDEAADEIVEAAELPVKELAEELPVKELAEELVEAELPMEANAEVNVPEVMSTHDTGTDSEIEAPRRRFWPGFWAGFGAAAVCAILIWVAVTQLPQSTCPEPSGHAPGEAVAIPPVDADGSTTDVRADATVPDTLRAPDVKSSLAAADSNPSVPTGPSDAPVYDMITKTRYLTTMAKDHYGNYHLWPYIYRENAKILGHPDRIKPGTRVVIPDLAKYGVDPKNADHIDKAKRLGVEIYARYQ